VERGSISPLMVSLKNNSLLKVSTSRINKGNVLDVYEIHLITGKKIITGRDYFRKSVVVIKNLIREGAVVKVVRITPSGSRETIFP